MSAVQFVTFNEHEIQQQLVAHASAMWPHEEPTVAENALNRSRRRCTANNDSRNGLSALNCCCCLTVAHLSKVVECTTAPTVSI